MPLHHDFRRLCHIFCHGAFISLPSSSPSSYPAPEEKEGTMVDAEGERCEESSLARAAATRAGRASRHSLAARRCGGSLPRSHRLSLFPPLVGAGRGGTCRGRRWKDLERTDGRRWPDDTVEQRRIGGRGRHRRVEEVKENPFNGFDSCVYERVGGQH